MRKTTTLALCALAAVLAAPTAHAQQPLKIGVILPYSGQFADGATQLDNAAGTLPIIKATYSGLVADVSGNTLIINIGNKVGVRVGDTIDISA